VPKMIRREAQLVSKAEFFSAELGLPEKVELDHGVIGPYSDAGKLTLLANWGADDIIRLTGPEIWREALEHFGKTR
jgi:hypothetical protein